LPKEILQKIIVPLDWKDRKEIRESCKELESVVAQCPYPETHCVFFRQNGAIMDVSVGPFGNNSLPLTQLPEFLKAARRIFSHTGLKSVTFQV
ncbi:hypothetical protein PFISCL1PPCAC_18694, partial [Pristionchus fissidentatus]